MKARIERKDETREIPTTTYSKGWFGTTKETTTVDKIVSFNVYLYLELTEEELAIIFHRMLDDVVIDYMELDPSETIAELEQRIAVTSNRFLRDELLYQIEAAKKWQPHPIKVSTFLANPHTRCFSTPHEANDYSKKLKESILPKIKELIEDNKSVASSDTFEV